MSSRITYCKDIYYFQVFLLVPAKGLMALVNGIVTSATPLFSKIWAWWSEILNTYS